MIYFVWVKKRTFSSIFDGGKVQHVVSWSIYTRYLSTETVFSIQVLYPGLSSTNYAVVSKLIVLVLTQTFDENPVISFRSIHTTADVIVTFELTEALFW